MELGEPRPEQEVLGGAEQLVADELVQRHAALQRAKAGHHAAAEDRIGLAIAQRLNQPRQLFRRVLPVAVNHGDVVEPLGNREGVTDFLIAAVTLVVLVAEHRHSDVGVVLLELATDGEGAVFRGVVDHEHFALVFVEDAARNSLENRAERVFRVVGNDENQQAFLLEFPHAFPLWRLCAALP